MQRLINIALALSLTQAYLAPLGAFAWQAETNSEAGRAVATVAPASPDGAMIAPINGPIGAGSSAAPTYVTPAGEKPGNAAEAQPAGDQAAVVDAQPPADAAAATNSSSKTAGANVLKGKVTQDGNSPLLLPGVKQDLPKNTPVSLTMMLNLNSEVTQKGSEVWARVSRDVPGAPGNGVGLPGGWYAHGMVTDAKGQRRAGVNGYVEIEFDKLVSPDGSTEVPFNAKASTKDKMMTTVAKQVLRGSGYVGYGAALGSFYSLQITGIPLAVASHGWTVIGGAIAGGTIGGYKALRNKGKIESVYEGEEFKFVTAEPITLPGFNPVLLPSAKPIPKLPGMNLAINKVEFGKDPSGDKFSTLLNLSFTVDNQTKQDCNFGDLAVLSDTSQRYFPSPMLLSNFAEMKKHVKPDTSASGNISFSVAGKKHKYWLVLFSRSKEAELMRVPIN